MSGRAGLRSTSRPRTRTHSQGHVPAPEPSRTFETLGGYGQGRVSRIDHRSDPSRVDSISLMKVGNRYPDDTHSDSGPWRQRRPCPIPPHLPILSSVQSEPTMRGRGVPRSSRLGTETGPPFFLLPDPSPCTGKGSVYSRNPYPHRNRRTLPIEGDPGVFHPSRLRRGRWK